MLFRMVPFPTPYGLPFLEIGGLQLSYTLSSQERVKIRTSNIVGTFIGSIGTKARKNVGNSSRGRSQGVPKIFMALRGHLCDSIAFLFSVVVAFMTLTFHKVV